MRPLEVRISYLISVGVVVLLAAVFWLAYGRYVLLEAIEDDFSSLQKVARTGRLAADVGSSLAALSAAIREYVASDAIEPSDQTIVHSRYLLAAVGRARFDLPGEQADIVLLVKEADLYLGSFEAVVTARRQRQERLKRLALAAGALRAASQAAGLQERFMQLREAELNYLSVRNAAEAERALGRLEHLAHALVSRQGAELTADYGLAFARVVEIFEVLDRGTVRVLDDHEARLRGLAAALARRAQAGEGSAASGFRETLSLAMRRNVEVILLAALIAVGGAFLLLRFVIYPLNRMSNTMTAIAAGDYSQAVPYVDRRDEIGRMARSLSTFRGALMGLKAAQTQAEAASRHKSDFIANMSHELRTPLNAIIGLSDMLLEDADSPDTRELKESLPRIGAAAKHLLGLINEILDLSKIEAGHMAVKLLRFAPASLAEETLATVAPMARQKGLRVAAVYPAQLPEILSDPQRVRQILINLLGNAVKFTDAGEVRMEVTASARGVEFTVVDTGPGIAAHDIGRLFQEFTQLDARPTRKFGGSGLGLALSRRMARLLGGDVTLASEVGRGSRFVLALPLEAPPPDMATHAEIVGAQSGEAARGGAGGAG